MSKLAFVTTCMGRLSFLQRSLPSVAVQPDSDCVVVDYSCPEQCGAWVREHYPQVQVVRVEGQTKFEICKARNAGIRAADAPWLCMFDADVVFAPSFAQVVLGMLEPNSFYRAQPSTTGIIGTLLAPRALLERIGGYDECHQGYGGEDHDVYEALRFIGATERRFPAALLKHLPHDDQARVRFHDQKDLWHTVTTNRFYRRLKFDLARLTGDLPPLADRPELYRQAVRLMTDAVQTNSAGTLRHVYKQETVPRADGILERSLTYRFIPSPQTTGEPPAPQNAAIAEVATGADAVSQGPAAPRSRPARKILFCSYHCVVDSSSGAAISLLDTLAALRQRGWECAVLSGPMLDFERKQTPAQHLTEQEVSFDADVHATDATPHRLLRLERSGVPVVIYQPDHVGKPTAPAEAAPFHALLEQTLDRIQPDVVLTYGGNEVGNELIARVRRRRVPIVFWLRNLSYKGGEILRATDGILVPSQFLREHYGHNLGMESKSIPSIVDRERVLCETIDRKYVTFVNPQPYKGVFWFARMVHEMGQRRPDIPFLVVEGRGGAEWLLRTGIDLSEATNLEVLAHTKDPRDFYGLSRIVLMPSIWSEPLGRVSIEALINGIPVLASRRGGLCETLTDAGFLFDIPLAYQQNPKLLPTPEEVRPWLDTILRLWDDPAFYEAERHRCLAAAERFRPEKLALEYEKFLLGIVARKN